MVDLQRIGTYPKKAAIWLRSWQRLSHSDVILASFPKTGSSWVRLFLFHYIFDINSNSVSFDDLDRKMPEFGHPSMLEYHAPRYSARVVKTHQPYPSIFNGRKAVVVTRDPRDVMISYFHYLSARKDFRFGSTIDDLVRSDAFGVKAYCIFHRRWLANPHYLIRYEDLRSDPYEGFTGLLKYMGVEPCSSKVVRALESSSMEKTRAAQKHSSESFQRQFSAGFQFARSGTIGEGRSELHPELKDHIRIASAKYGFSLYDLS